MAQRLYKPARGACTHSHRTVVDAIECARNLHSDLDIVALKNGHAERLDEVEERIRSAALTLYDKTDEEILDVQTRTEARSGSVASQAGLDSLAPDTPWSTYSSTMSHPRRPANSRNSTSCISGL